MPRSRITEDQVLDGDFASEQEMAEYISTVSGSLRTYIDDSFTRIDGTKGFISTVSGVDPTLPYHLSTKYYVDQVAAGLIPLNVAYVDQPQTISGGWVFGTISPEFNISPLFDNNVIWLARNSVGGVEDVFWARASDDNTYLNWGSGDHFYVRDNNGVVHYDFTPIELDAKDSDIRTTGVFYGDGSGLTNLSVVASGTSYFDGYDNTGGTSVTDSWTDVPIYSRKKSLVFTHINNDAEITIGKTDTYIVMARVTTTISTGSNRTDSSMRIVIDTGSGYTDVPGTTAVMYNRTSDNGENTGTSFAILDLNDGDKIKVQVKRDDGGSTLQLLNGGSSLLAFNTRGPSGADGSDGVDGAPGPSGSGSTINIQDDYTTVYGSPFEVLNFSGDGIQANQTSSGTVTIEHRYKPFGDWYSYVDDYSTSSTTSTSYVNKISMTVNDIPESTYRVGWYFEWLRDSASNDFMSRVRVDNSTDVMELNEESKDNTSWHIEGGFAIISLSSGTHIFDLDYCGETGFSTSYIRRARFEFWRIS